MPRKATINPSNQMPPTPPKSPVKPVAAGGVTIIIEPRTGAVTAHAPSMEALDASLEKLKSRGATA
jgi:hypothetical protein